MLNFNKQFRLKTNEHSNFIDNFDPYSKFIYLLNWEPNWSFTTIPLIFITAIIGVYYAKYEGLNTFKSGVSQIYKNQMPLFELMSGAALAVAAFLLILPGFATDLLGFLIIFPFTRKIIFHLFSKIEKVN